MNLKMSFPTFQRKTFNQTTKNYQSIFDQYQISLVIEQVGKIITNLLQNITYIYKANGISYPVQQYYGVLMRILAPIELTNSMNKNVDYNVSYMPRGSSKSNESKEELRENQLGQSYVKLENEKNQSFNEKYEADEGRSVISKIVNQNEQILPAQVQNKNGRSSQLGRSQRKIYEWAKKKVSRGEQLLRKDIIFQACKIAAQKGIQFRGSSGWYSRFLNRNPEMRILMESQKFKKEVKQQSFEDRDYNSWRFQLKSSCSEENQADNDQITEIMHKNKSFQEDDGESAQYMENEQQIQVQDQVKYKKSGQYFPTQNMKQKNKKSNEQSSEKKGQRLPKNLFY